VNAAWAALVNGAILSALLAAAVWLALRVAPGRTGNAATRYLIWWLALALALLLPALCGLKTRSRTGVSRAGVSSGGARGVPAAGHKPAPAMRQESWALPAGAPALEIRGGSWQRWLFAGWLVSSGLLLLRLARSYRALVRAGADAGDAPDDLRRRAPAWCAALGMEAGCIRVACSPYVSVPVALGPRRTILIPAHLLTELDAEELDHVGLHEAAHLARRDDLALLGQRVIEALFCLHPVVLWISRRIDLEREIACDDLAVAATRNPRTYAACLTRMVELCGGVRESLAAANFAHRAHISQRVELIMNQPRHFTPQPLVSRLGAFALALCALAAVLVNRPALVAFAAPQAATRSAQEAPKPAPAPAVPIRTAAAPQRPSPAPVPAPRADSPPDSRMFVVLLFDVSTMTSATLSAAAERAATIARERIPAGQEAAVVVYSDGMLHVRQDFTGDRDLIEQSLRGLSAISGAPSDSSARLATIRAAIDMVKPLNGKKMLICFSGGPRAAGDDSAQVATVIDAAVRANVAIYAIDAHTAR
jgi:beta-lactamase regulating signal transducer with metallopeptidase domain